MEDSRAVEIYTTFRQLCSALDPQPSFARFPSDFKSMGPSFDLMVFATRANDQRLEVTNFVNEFSHYLAQLRVWVEVLSGLDEDERGDVLLEFVHPTSAFCLGAPYAIKGRICASTAELARLVNEIRRLPDASIDLSRTSYKLAKRLASRWSSWPALSAALSRLDTKDFRAEVEDFRNKFHHGIPHNIEIGQNLTASRTEADGSINYSLGLREPLALSHIAEALQPQCEAALESCAAYVALVEEQHRSLDG